MLCYKFIKQMWVIKLSALSITVLKGKSFVHYDIENARDR